MNKEVEDNPIVRLNIELPLKDRYKLKEIAARQNVPLRVIVSALIGVYIQQEEEMFLKDRNEHH